MAAIPRAQAIWLNSVRACKDEPHLRDLYAPLIAERPFLPGLACRPTIFACPSGGCFMASGLGPLPKIVDLFLGVDCFAIVLPFV